MIAPANFAANFYADWRRHAGLVPALHEAEAAPPEKLLQAAWQHQRLRRASLNTMDGRTLRVIHPGFRNFEAGPDFRGALVQFGDSPPQTGDVEIDLVANGWHTHGHDRNPNFKHVLLHVVWAAPKDLAPGLPTLALQGLLDSPLPELDLWLGGETAEALPEIFRGKCCAPLRELSAASLTELLQQAAQGRFQGKAGWFAARAREDGWEQALWEGLFRALGYKQNVWPMLRLAELRGALSGGRRLSVLAWQARLLGVAGLLPHELTRRQAATDDYLKRVWNLWWRERDAFAGVTLPRGAWKFNGLRPANHPVRRLALAAHWLVQEKFTTRLEDWLISGAAAAASQPAANLLEVLQGGPDEFWDQHWTLNSARMPKPQPLLGAARAGDLAVNVILPWLWARAQAGGNGALRKAIEQRYFAWPASEDNAVLKLARQRLLGGAGRGVFRTAAAQQGLLQVVRDFCEHSNAACEACKFPELVRAWGARGTTT